MKIYFAGPDVLRKYDQGWFDFIASICENYNVEPILPIDNGYQGEKVVKHEEIYEINLAKINMADCIVANLQPFRGPSADPGVCVEVGYARALNKKVYGHYNGYLPGEYIDRVNEYLQKVYHDRPEWLRSELYPKIEDFNIMDNLMIINSCTEILPDILGAISRASGWADKTERDKLL